MKRKWMMVAIVGALSVASATAALAGPVMDVYKSATCGCCGRWAEHMRSNGIEVRTHDVPDVARHRQRLGMPEGLGSCHTAVIDGYVIEGHVPAADVRRLLADKPRALGLALPGMPGGSPGMENVAAVRYEVLLVSRNASITTFARH